MAELPQEFFNRIKDACRLAEEKAYQQGRADKYQEITSEYMLLTENQVEEIRADAIEEYKHKLITDVSARAQSFENIHDKHDSEIFNYATRTFVDALKFFKEELKEKKNE